MANFVKANESMYQHVQQDTANFGLGGFQVAHMQQPPPPPPQQQPPHPLLNCGAHEKSTPYNVSSAHHSQMHPHSFVHHQQQLHHHQFLARHHHLTGHAAAVMHYHHDEKRGKRNDNVPTAYFPSGIMPLNASK